MTYLFKNIKLLVSFEKASPEQCISFFEEKKAHKSRGIMQYNIQQLNKKCSELEQSRIMSNVKTNGYQLF